MGVTEKGSSVSKDSAANGVDVGQISRDGVSVNEDSTDEDGDGEEVAGLLTLNVDEVINVAFSRRERLRVLGGMVGVEGAAAPRTDWIHNISGKLLISKAREIKKK